MATKYPRRTNTDPIAFTIAEFADAHRISRSTFYNLLKAGDGPRVCKIGRRSIITREAADEWRARLSAAGS